MESPHTVLYSIEIKIFISYYVLLYVLSIICAPASCSPGIMSDAPYERRFILFQFRTGSKVAKKAATIQKIDTAVKSLPFS